MTKVREIAEQFLHALVFVASRVDRLIYVDSVTKVREKTQAVSALWSSQQVDVVVLDTSIQRPKCAKFMGYKALQVSEH